LSVAQVYSSEPRLTSRKSELTLIETPYVATRLRRAQAELRELPEEQQRIWEATLKEHALHTLRAEQQDTLRAYLSEFLANLYEARRNKFARFLKLQMLLSFLVLN